MILVAQCRIDSCGQVPFAVGIKPNSNLRFKKSWLTKNYKTAVPAGNCMLDRTSRYPASSDRTQSRCRFEAFVLYFLVPAGKSLFIRQSWGDWFDQVGAVRQHHAGGWPTGNSVQFEYTQT